MSNDTLKIRAKIYSAQDYNGSSRCYANLSINDALFINSIGIMPSRYNNNELYIYLPKNQFNGKKCYFEFPTPKENPLYLAIEKAVKSAYSKFLNRHMLHVYGDTFNVSFKDIISFKPTSSNEFDEEELPTDEDLDKPINYEDIPF